MGTTGKELHVGRAWLREGHVNAHFGDGAVIGHKKQTVTLGVGSCEGHKSRSLQGRLRKKPHCGKGRPCDVVMNSQSSSP